MFLKEKPIRFGYKAWTLASSEGYVYQFDIYSGKSTGAKSSKNEDFGLGGGELTMFPVIRKCKRKKFLLHQPRLIDQYNAKMGGVDLCDNLMANYRIAIRGKKWWWPIFRNFIAVALVNAWKISRLSTSESKKYILDFRRKFALFLLHTSFQSGKLAKCKSATGRPSKCRVQKSLHAEPGHFIIKSEDNRRLRSKQCHNQTVYRCNICSVALHRDYREVFHV
ncbi:hypothetical protein AVEN_245-1 [Araneus ventricosus]|uniref:PiggyBac transposable element-derived protein domain-containing protein n=1 Tax=Araneus ventricosus TaxID=182803 RepID=A0A4Y2KJL7_ARAVE|nr:hypothetical protein AVEN_245-1 [Araneus ventricosus]